MTEPPDTTPEEREMLRGLIAYWDEHPSALHEFRTAIFGHQIADWMRDRDFPSARYLEAANVLLQVNEDDCEFVLRKTREEVMIQLREMSLQPDEQKHREWLRTVEFFLANRRSYSGVRSIMHNSKPPPPDKGHEAGK